MRIVALLATALLGTPIARGQVDAFPGWREWNEPVRAFAITENITYVGVKEISSFLVSTPAGYIIIDSGFHETVPRIMENLKLLGIDPRKVRYILTSHAHGDHVGGHAELKRLTGARVVASAADADLMARGGKRDPHFGDRISYRPITVDQHIGDGEVVELGGVKLTALITPGHTKGCTTWTMTSRLEGRDYPVVFACSITAPGYKLVDNAEDPGVVADFRASFARLDSLDCQVFLSAHGSMFALDEKRRRLEAGDKAAFVDPRGCKEYVRSNREKLEKELARQAVKHPSKPGRTTPAAASRPSGST